MIGMSFTVFVTILVISGIWAAIVHGSGYKALSGTEGYLAKVIAGWIGGWIGSSVLGFWGPTIAGSNFYGIPVILGSIAAIFVEVTLMRALLTATSGRMSQLSQPTTPSASAPLTSTEPRRVA